MYRYFMRIVNSDYVLKWKFKGLSEEITKSLSTPNNLLNPKLSYYGNNSGGSLQLCVIIKNSAHLNCLWDKWKI